MPHRRFKRREPISVHVHEGLKVKTNRPGMLDIYPVRVGFGASLFEDQVNAIHDDSFVVRVYEFGHW